MFKPTSAFDVDMPKSDGLKQPKSSKQPLSISIVETLSLEIGHGKRPPGMHLEEEWLCNRFGASRTPVREALRQLAARGLIEIKPRQGAFVIQLGTALVIEMFEVMGFLEAACSSLAARRHNAQDRLALTQAHQECIDAADRDDPEAFYRANAKFHECIYGASHNRHLQEQTLGLRNRLEAYRKEVTFHAGLMAISIQEHAMVLRGILEMNQELAASCMSKHLDTLRSDAVSMASIASRPSESFRRQIGP
jgi:DNA-binding GntR family transcriptional regulator